MLILGWTLWFGRYCRETKPSLLCSFRPLGYFYPVASPTRHSSKPWYTLISLILSEHCKHQRDVWRKEEMLWRVSTDNDLNALVLPRLYHKLIGNRKCLTFLLAFTKVPSNSVHVITPVFSWIIIEPLLRRRHKAIALKGILSLGAAVGKDNQIVNEASILWYASTHGKSAIAHHSPRPLLTLRILV